MAAIVGLFAPAIRDTNSLVVPNVCMYEVFKRMLVQRGEEDALQAIGVMSIGVISDLTQEIAINAAQISPELKIAMADSMILATARKYNAVNLQKYWSESIGNPHIHQLFWLITL